MWAVESADGKWRGRGLENRGEESGDTAFAVGPRDVACRPPVGREVREKEANAIQTQVNRHVEEWTGDTIP